MEVERYKMIYTKKINEELKSVLSYFDDLDRFIEGQIGFEEIQGFVHEDVPLQEAIKCSLTYARFYYSKEEHDLYEKLCYAEVLHCIEYYEHEEMYAIYLFAKDRCFPHKLDWDGLLEKIKMESRIDDTDIVEGASMYKQCQKKGGYYSDLLPADYYED